MFRPAPELTLFQVVPFRLIGAVLLILAVVVSLLLLVSVEHEKLLVHGLTEGQAVPTGLFQTLWQSRQDLILIAALLFLVSAVGLSAVITFLHYGNTRRTLEEVKGLARNILESIPTGILAVNCNGLITVVNPAAEAILGRSAGDLLGHPYDGVFREGDAVRAVLDGALKGRLHVDHKDLPYGDVSRGMRTIRMTSVELPEDGGRSSGVILQAQDVTEWLTLERRVRVAEKLSALHTLSAGVAHELRNPLSALDLNLHLLEEELRGRHHPVQVDRYLDVLSAETRRLTGILDNFMRFSRPGAIRVQEVDVAQLLAHVSSLLDYEAREHRIDLQVVLEEGLGTVMGDETQISQVLVNIIVNAFHAMPDGGICRIAAARRCLAGKLWLEVSVQDTGTGIKTEEMSRLFEPFFTTKEQGSGLGLAIAYRIVQDHGGTIEAQSAPASGTTVTVRLPANAVKEPAEVTGA